MKRLQFSFNLKVKLLLLLSLPVLMYIGSNALLISQYDRDMNEISRSLFATTNKVNTLVLNADRDLYQALAAYEQLKLEQGTGADVSSFKDDMESNAKQAEERITEANGILQTEGLLQLASAENGTTIEAIITMFQADYPVWKSEMENSAAENDGEMASGVLDTFNKLRGGINVIGEILDAYATDRTQYYTDQIDTKKQSAFIGVALCVVLIGTIGFLIIRNLSRIVNYMRKLTSAVASGDLREMPSIKRGNDELGQIAGSIELMTANLRQLISTISSNAKQVSESSEQMQVASRQSSEAAASVAVEIQGVSDSMETQVKGAEESARAIVEMAVGIGRVAENTSAVSEYAQSTTQITDTGKQQIEHLVTQMGGIKSIITDLSQIVNNLNERSREIGQIAVQITSFSNQTNILSLNASIEAARAGEHGRGFTVVAGEIRKLAAASLQSADVINQLVAATQEEVHSASAVMDKTITEVEQGSRTLSVVTQGFVQVQSSITNIASQIHDNSAITEQMSASAEEVSATMEQSAFTSQMTLDATRSVAAATEQQLALMEDITTAADQLRQIVQELNASVSSFKVQ